MANEANEKKTAEDKIEDKMDETPEEKFKAQGEESQETIGKGDPSSPLQNIGSTIADLRKKNPKVFYGGVAAILFIMFFLFTRGGGVESTKIPTVTMGQTYELRNPNVGDVLLVATPGKLSSAEAKEEDSQNICVVKGGTRATVLEEAVVNYIPYVKVKPIEGDCVDKTGWTSKVNIKVQ